MVPNTPLCEHTCARVRACTLSSAEVGEGHPHTPSLCGDTRESTAPVFVNTCQHSAPQPQQLLLLVFYQVYHRRKMRHGIKLLDKLVEVSAAGDNMPHQ